MDLACLSCLMEGQHQRAQAQAEELIWTETTYRGRGIRAGSEWVGGGGRLWLLGEQGFFGFWFLFCGVFSPIAYVSVHQNPEVGQGWREISAQTCHLRFSQPVKIIAVRVASAEWKGKPSQSFQQLMVLVISTLINILCCFLGGDPAHSSLKTIQNCPLLLSSNDCGEKEQQNLPQALLCRWGGQKLVSFS